MNASATSKCGRIHIEPARWTHVREEDGYKRAYCPACGAFLGYVYSRVKYEQSDNEAAIVPGDSAKPGRVP